MAVMIVANSILPPSQSHPTSLPPGLRIPHKEVKMEQSTKAPLEGKISRVACQPTKFISYSSAKFDKAATSFQELQLWLQLFTQRFKTNVRDNVELT